ncbi:diacylglycerol lipase-beta-like isoform X2 [Cloeon dipterum]
MFPELIWNIFGSLWVYELGEVMPRCPGEAFASTVIKGVLIFNWVSLTATLFGLALLFDPMGSSRFYAPCDGGTTCEDHQHERYAERSRDIWLRRFSWLFCWMQPDEHSRTAFNDVAGLFSALFRSTNLVPSDVAAAFVLLRVRQKQEVRLQREKLAESRGDQEWTQHFPTHAQGISAPLNLDEETRIIGAPDWMKLSTAKHYLKFSMAAYGWPLVMYLHCFTGLFRLLPYMSCCGCIRSKTPRVVEDNCCLCNVAGMRTLSGVPSHDILYASFRNRLFEVPFLVVADHSTKSIVVVMRGSISVRDIFTDFTAASYELEAPELPPNCKGHKGMIHVAQYVLKTLEQEHVLTEAFDSYPDYELVLTGHSLGAGVAVMLGLMLKPTYPKLRCFAFAAPGGLLCPEAAVASESFTLTVGLGDDLVMRLGVDSIENLRTDLLTAIHRCVEPKYRMLVDGFMYVLFGVPDRVLERTWENANADEKRKRRSTSQYRTIKKLVIGPAHSIEASRLACNVASRRFSEQRLYSPGKILHITRCKSAGPNGTDRRRHHELRWASKEHFTQLRVMPRMILDHLPENILAALDDLLDEHEQRVSSGLESVEVSSS